MGLVLNLSYVIEPLIAEDVNFNTTGGDRRAVEQVGQKGAAGTGGVGQKCQHGMLLHVFLDGADGQVGSCSRK